MMMASSLGVVGAILAILSIPITGSSLGGTNGSSGFGIGIGGIATLRRTRLPPNSQDPDYIHTTSSGGYIGKSGGDGAITFICKLPAVGMSDALELRAQYFARLEDKLLEDDDLVVGASSDGTTTTMMKKREVAYQQYRVPGDERRGPYFREVTVKVWGAGGGGCDGGKLVSYCYCCCGNFP